MKYAVTAATGHFGQAAVKELNQLVGAGQVVVIVRNAEKAAQLFPANEVRVADYGDQAALEKALAGIDRVLFVSSQPGGAVSRDQQHRNVVAALKAAKVARVVYTSFPHADRGQSWLAADHRLTEQLLAESGLTHAVVRNNWYLENEASFLKAIAAGQAASYWTAKPMGWALESEYAAGAARVLVADLSAPDATASIVAATDGLDIGLLIYCAAADADFAPFLENSIDAAERMLQRNCLIPMQLSHHFGRAMVARGRGGIVVLSSGAGFVGAPNMAAYGATKAFDMIFAESLWGELRDQGVDALGVVLGETDTPSLRRLREQRGLAGPDEPVRGATAPDEVFRDAFQSLGKNPTCMAGKQMRRGSRLINPIPRGVLVRLMIRVTRRTMGADR